MIFIKAKDVLKMTGITKEQFQRLKELSNISKNIYNQALYIVGKEFERTQNYINYNKFDKNFL
jgi:hypothetical protein